MNIYFCGSIRGGRQKVDDYRILIDFLKEYGKVLTEHVGDPNLSVSGEKNSDPCKIYERDIAWLKKSDVVIADISIASLGVGYEVAYAELIKKPLICIFDKKTTPRPTAMIAGNKDIITCGYIDTDEAKIIIQKFLEKSKLI